MNLETLSAFLLFTVAATGTVGLLIYMVTIPWWVRPDGAKNRAGRAYCALFGSLLLVIWHFVIEIIFGQQPIWIEVALIGLVQAAILFNIYTSLSKQLRGRRERHPANS